MRRRNFPPPPVPPRTSVRRSCQRTSQRFFIEKNSRAGIAAGAKCDAIENARVGKFGREGRRLAPLCHHASLFQSSSIEPMK
jgi:hypothetical protein